MRLFEKLLFAVFFTAMGAALAIAFAAFVILATE